MGIVAAVKRQEKRWYLFLLGDIYRLGYIVSCPQRLVIDSSFDKSTVNEFGKNELKIKDKK